MPPPLVDKILFVLVITWITGLDIGVSQNRRPTQIVFVRHAETVANATGHYTDKTVKEFTRKGKKQVAELTRNLEGLTFDAILVSPIIRCRNTIRPYLESRHLKGYIWPELAECCYQRKTSRIVNLNSLRRGSPVNLERDEQRIFAFRTTDDQRRFDIDTYAEGIAMIKRSCERLRAEFSGTGMRVLVIGHSLSGSRMMEILSGAKPRGHIAVENGELNILEEVKPGIFIKTDKLRNAPEPFLTESVSDPARTEAPIQPVHKKRKFRPFPERMIKGKIEVPISRTVNPN